ncbi:hypothetical protein RKD46_008380 [Streptomyces pseudovenezuelae]
MGTTRTSRHPSGSARRAFTRAGAAVGPLYQVRRASDDTIRTIGLLSTGGYADAAAQDSFCSGTTCLITIVYDQSGRGNHLPPGARRRCRGWYRQPRERDGRAHHGGRSQGLRRLRGTRH